MNRKIVGIAALAGFFVVAFGGAYYLSAQMGGGGMRPQQGQRQQQMGGMQQRQGMMGGGAMVVYGKYIYVLMGPNLMQVDPVSMKVVKEAMLKGKMAAAGGRDIPEDMLDGE